MPKTPSTLFVALERFIDHVTNVEVALQLWIAINEIWILNSISGRGELFVICCNIFSFMHKFEFLFSRAVSVIYRHLLHPFVFAHRTHQGRAISAPHHMIQPRNALEAIKQNKVILQFHLLNMLKRL